ncbi:hypothetical protein [Rhodococcoides fascians]|uniref:hypothetical protein n=1 Tax=Rhodococcoides fascians TaxID=1828 RepID=UPI0005661694|nr:hypothetical protein [Rhodococcus fascians]
MGFFDLFRRRKTGRIDVTADDTSIAAVHVPHVEVRQSDLDAEPLDVIALLQAEQERQFLVRQAALLRSARQPSVKPRTAPARTPRPSNPSASSTYDPTPSIIASTSYSSSYDSGSSSSSCDSGGGGF